MPRRTPSIIAVYEHHMRLHCAAMRAIQLVRMNDPFKLSPLIPHWPVDLYTVKTLELNIDQAFDDIWSEVFDEAAHAKIRAYGRTLKAKTEGAT
ncbi:MAG: hypothetical protein A2Y78_08385 [Acidobacteria bacterium RBG_13_68_16]|nr:MAG: hypothetical protein A2Y78_08385 [Acidobacteria bacterium RBG_13_68_16]